jgi:hypothetical protein
MTSYFYLAYFSVMRSVGITRVVVRVSMIGSAIYHRRAYEHIKHHDAKFVWNIAGRTDGENTIVITGKMWAFPVVSMGNIESLSNTELHLPLMK